MLEPKKLKYRKPHRNRGAVGGKATRGATLAFGSIGLKVTESGEITARQIEAATVTKRGAMAGTVSGSILIIGYEVLKHLAGWK